MTWSAAYPKQHAAILEWNRSEKGRAVRNAETRRAYKANIQKKRAQRRAYAAVIRALADGTLTRPEQCPKCEKTPSRRCDGRTRIQFHHTEGYAADKVLVGVFVCDACHRAMET
jgi:hypothetical protein